MVIYAYPPSGKFNPCRRGKAEQNTLYDPESAATRCRSRVGPKGPLIALWQA